MATINLITATEQHQVATVGFDASVCRREDSMCDLTLAAGHPVVVPDARTDPRFHDNPFVTGVIGQVRFYASHPLVTPDGIAIGTLCVFDEEPRSLDQSQERALAGLADRVVDLLELELRTRRLHASIAALRRTHHELARSNEDLAAFAGRLSHDLRNPLGAVSMSLRLLDHQIDEGAGPDQLHWLTERAASGVRRMEAMIEDLLVYARLGGELRREDVDLAALLAEVQEDLADALAGAVVSVGPLPTVTGDPVQLAAVLQNLLANAAKFTRDGRPARIEVGADRTADGWRVLVVDHGPGIPEQDRERVFEPMVRAHTRIPGQGIGLATVRRVVQAHGGRAGLEETPGGGATAWVELPG
nr:GAF domain-containing sensor histidine kinase [Nocardioides panaciterrulae]